MFLKRPFINLIQVSLVSLFLITLFSGSFSSALIHDGKISIFFLKQDIFIETFDSKNVCAINTYQLHR